MADAVAGSAGRSDMSSKEMVRGRQTPSRCSTETLTGSDNVLAYLKAAPELKAHSVFQSPVWLQNIYEHLVDADVAEAALVVAKDASSGSLLLAVPLALVRERSIRVAGFPDYGVCDYFAPLTGPAWDAACEQTRFDAWQAVLSSLPRVDRLTLTSVPARDALGELAMTKVGAVMPSRHQRHVLSFPEGVDAFLRSRGKKYRKEVERCTRLLQTRGAVQLRKAEKRQEIEDAFDILKSLQNRRWQNCEGEYRLDQHHLSTFYRAALLSEHGDGQALIFTLHVGESVAGALYGLLWRDTFTLLRIASDNENWGRASPGRMIVIETMRHFAERGITTFDLGIGDYAFKRGIGAKAEALIDLEKSVSLRGLPAVMTSRARARLRRLALLRRLANQIRQRQD